MHFWKMEESNEIWNEVMGTDIMTKHIVHGSGESASFGTIVKINMKTFICGASVPFEVLTNQRFKVGDGDAFPGMELPLRH